MLHSFLYLFSLVRISEFLYANFSSTVYASPQRLARPLNNNDADDDDDDLGDNSNNNYDAEFE